jgi:tetratricopeptide (TPR) repeat protein
MSGGESWQMRSINLKDKSMGLLTESLQANTKSQKAELAERFFLEEDFNAALNLYLEIVDDESQNALLHQRIAECYYALADYKKTEEACRKALDLNSELAIPHTLLSYLYFKENKAKESLAEAVTAYTLQPSSDQVLNCYGTILLADKKMEEAVPLLKQALSINPQNKSALNNLAIAYQWSKNYKQYLSVMRSIFEQKPSLRNFFKLLLAYQQRYAMAFTVVTLLSFPIAYIFDLKILLAIPAYVVLRGYRLSYQFLQNRQFRKFFVYLVTYSLFAVLVYMTFVSMN